MMIRIGQFDVNLKVEGIFLAWLIWRSSAAEETKEYLHVSCKLLVLSIHRCKCEAVPVRCSLRFVKKVCSYHPPGEIVVARTCSFEIMCQELECLICASWIDFEIACTRRASSVPSPELVRLPCRCREGFYHRACLVECWKQRSPTRCPLCRTALLSIEGCMRNEGFVAAVFDTLDSLVPDDQTSRKEAREEQALHIYRPKGRYTLPDSLRGRWKWMDVVVQTWDRWPVVSKTFDACNLLTAILRDGRMDLLGLATGRDSLLPWDPWAKDSSLMHFALQNILRDILLKDGSSIFLRPDMISGKFLNPPDGQTLLHLVCRFHGGLLRIATSKFVSHLLRAKADPFEADSNGWSPLRIALEQDDYHLEDFLFLTREAGVHTDSDLGGCIWQRCGVSAKPVQVDLSPDKCPIPYVVLDALRSMFDRPTKTGIREDQRERRRKSIHYLLKAGASVDEADETGMTPLMYAVESGDIEVVKVLLFHGADPEKPNPHSSVLPIFEAARCGFTDIVRALVCGVAEDECDSSYDYYINSPRLRTNVRQPILGKQLETTPTVEPLSGMRRARRGSRRCGSY